MLNKLKNEVVRNALSKYIDNSEILNYFEKVINETLVSIDNVMKIKDEESIHTLHQALNESATIKSNSILKVDKNNCLAGTVNNSVSIR